ncbi:MAG: AI-2E family transporter [Candidatus Pacearchaeota archaeon]
MVKDDIKKYLFLTFLLILLFYSYMIIKDFITIILSSFILSYIMLPLHKKISKKTNKYLSASICIFLSLFLITLLLFIIGKNLYLQVEEIIQNKSAQEVLDNIKSLIERQKVPYTQNILSFIEKNTENFIYSFSDIIINFIKGMINLIVVFFMSYFILIHWDRIKKEFYEILPFENKTKIMEKIKSTSDSIIKTSFLIAFLEFLISLIFFKIMGLKYYFFLAFLIAVLAFIPLIGPAVVWLPIIIFSLINQNYFTAIAFLIYGVVMSYLIDSLLRNIISSKEAKINPIIMFIGLVGGIKIFGLAGIIVGPVILIITLQIFFDVLT